MNQCKTKAPSDIGVLIISKLVETGQFTFSAFESRGGKSYIKVVDAVGEIATYYMISGDKKDEIQFAADGKPVRYIVQGHPNYNTAKVVVPAEDDDKVYAEKSSKLNNLFNPGRALGGPWIEPDRFATGLMRITVQQIPWSADLENVEWMLDQIEATFAKQAPATVATTISIRR